MKTKRFRGNKPPPITAGIRKTKPLPTELLPPGSLTLANARKVDAEIHLPTKTVKGATVRVYAGRPWRNRCLAATVRVNFHGVEVWNCYLCGAELELRDVTVDHYIPRAAGGTHRASNLRPCCFPCNNRKADLVPGAIV